MYTVCGTMSGREPAASTAPACRTEADGSESTELALVWAFPIPALAATRAGDPRVLLGRSDDCGVKLAGSEISRRHAELVRMGSLWVLRDLGSRNGSFVNGKRLAQGAPLSVGDVVRLGESVGVVQRVPRTSAWDDARFAEIAPSLYGGPRLQSVLEPARRVAGGSLRIVVQGETGTGKERVARAIHLWSLRPGPFVGVNCSALAEGIVEAELFGHRKGAFSGAHQASLGYLRAADKGTLLLDEITEMPLAVQAKLLRALEENAVVPVGESTPISIDVRIVVASQEPLPNAVREKRFRPDLCARLSGMSVELPPLRERSEDVPGLLAAMLARHSGKPTPMVSPRLVERLCTHHWPFNVRELDQLARRFVELHGDEPTLRCSHLPEELRTPPSRGASQGRTGPLLNAAAASAGQEGSVSPWPTESVEVRRERELIALADALRQHNGVLARATQALGITRQKAYRLLESLSVADRNLVRDRSVTSPKKRNVQ